MRLDTIPYPIAVDSPITKSDVIRLLHSDNYLDRASVAMSPIASNIDHIQCLMDANVYVVYSALSNPKLSDSSLTVFLSYLVSKIDDITYAEVITFLQLSYAIKDNTEAKFSDANKAKVSEIIGTLYPLL